MAWNKRSRAMPNGGHLLILAILATAVLSFTLLALGVFGDEDISPSQRRHGYGFGYKSTREAEHFRSRRRSSDLKNVGFEGDAVAYNTGTTEGMTTHTSDPTTDDVTTVITTTPSGTEPRGTDAYTSTVNSETTPDDADTDMTTFSSPYSTSTASSTTNDHGTWTSTVHTRTTSTPKTTTEELTTTIATTQTTPETTDMETTTPFISTQETTDSTTIGITSEEQTIATTLTTPETTDIETTVPTIRRTQESTDSPTSTSTIRSTTNLASTRSPYIPEDKVLELEEIEKEYSISTDTDKPYDSNLENETSAIYQNYTTEISNYYNETTSGFKELRNVTYSPNDNSIAVRLLATSSCNCTTMADYVLVYDYLEMEENQTCNSLCLSETCNCTDVTGDINVCDYTSEDSCPESAYDKYQEDDTCICRSKCLNDTLEYCKNGGECIHTRDDELACLCDFGDNQVTFGDQCEISFRRDVAILTLSVCGAVVVITIIILIICVCKAKAQKHVDANNVSKYHGIGSPSFREYIRHTNTFDNVAYDQNLDYDADSYNFDDLREPTSPGTFVGMTNLAAEESDDIMMAFQPVNEDGSKFGDPDTQIDHAIITVNGSTSSPKDFNSFYGTPESYPEITPWSGVAIDRVDPYKDFKIRRARFNPDYFGNSVWTMNEDQL